MNSTLKLLPKYDSYMVYMNHVIISCPVISRQSTGDEFRKAMYQTLYQIYRLLYVQASMRMSICNELDALFAYQRALIRAMYELRYIDISKKINSIKLLGELGKMLGGYVKGLGVSHGKEN